MNKEFGICMAGCERGLEHWLRNAVSLRYAMGGVQFCYLEIGVASGQTLVSMAEILKDAVHGNMEWSAVGIDIPDGWSLDRGSILSKPTDFPIFIREKPDDLLCLPAADAITVYLHPAAEFLRNWKVPIGFALIDGCHNKECCKADFRAVEQHCFRGSIVAFHDAAENEQSGPPDGHANVIQVYQALTELGLLNQDNDTWELVEWLHGDKKDPSNFGNSCAVFRKR